MLLRCTATPLLKPRILVGGCRVRSWPAAASDAINITNVASRLGASLAVLSQVTTVRPDRALYRRAQDAVAAVDSNLNAHVISFLRWLVGDTDELPPRPLHRRRTQPRNAKVEATTTLTSSNMCSIIRRSHRKATLLTTGTLAGDALSPHWTTGGLSMATFGYRIMELYITQSRKPERLSLKEPETAGGLRKALARIVNGAVAEGERDEANYRYVRISEVRESGWGILLTVQGGDYGDTAEVFDVENGNLDDPVREIKHSDAVLKNYRVLFIIPPRGDTGLLISEIRGRSHPTSALLKLLNIRLNEHGVKLRVTSELVDARAWSDFLDNEDVGVTGVELVQSTTSRDRTSFTEENVKSARLQITLVDGSAVKRRIVTAMRAMRDSHKPPKLAGLVGLRGFKDEDFDEEQVITVHDGRQRKIDVTSSWPRFTYPLDGDEQLTVREFVEEVVPVAQSTLRQLNVDLTADWRPKLLD